MPMLRRNIMPSTQSAPVCPSLRKPHGDVTLISASQPIHNTNNNNIPSHKNYYKTPPYLQQTLKPHLQRGWVEYLGEGSYIATFSYCWCSSEAPPQTRRLWLLDASLCASAGGRSVGLSVCLWQELSDSCTLQFECLYKPQTIYKSAREALNCLSVVEQCNVIRYYGYFTYICMLLPYKSSGSWSPIEKERVPLK